MVSVCPKTLYYITRFPRRDNMRVETRHTVEVVSGSELDVDVEVDMDVDDGFRVTVFCIVSVTLNTATVVGFA